MNRKLLVGALITLAAGGCAKLHRPNLPWRTIDPDSLASANPDAPCTPPTTRLALDQLPNSAIQRSLRCTSAEHFADPATQTTFDVHVVEFDDQGRFWNRTQVDDALDNVRAERDKGEVLVVTFFHGWFNNGDVCNGKLSCFRELISLIAEAEKWSAQGKLGLASRSDGKPRRVVGIFGAWRGETLAIPAAKFVTFWGRKSAAHTVGENGAVTELISTLFRTVHRLPVNGATAAAPDVSDDSSLVVIGHSFGGALVMSAIGNELNRAAGEALASRDGVPVSVRNRLADLVVLLNPAVEASRFDNLQQAASTASFSDKQLPLLLTLSSEKDSPNQILFPLGQSIAFAQKAARSRQQWQGMIQSLGTFRANQTHQLIARGTAPSADNRVANCQCDAGIAEYRDVLLAELMERLQRTGPGHLGAVTQQSAVGSRHEYLYSRLEPMQDTDPNNPFFMVHVDDEVIGGHSEGIFNPRTVDFLLEFLFSIEAKRRDARPTAVSATRPESVSAIGPQASTSTAACVVVKTSPDGPVSVVTLDRVLPDKERLVRIEYRNDGDSRRATWSTERFLDKNERLFPFTFTREGGTYLISVEDAPAPCRPVEHPGRARGERTPSRAFLLVGLADGLGAQFGGTVQLSRFVFEGSIIKKANTSRSELTTDLGIGYRGNRSVVGAGHRWRHDFEGDQVTARQIYTHFTLELPGVRFLNQTWSSWIGVEFSPLEWNRTLDSWKASLDFAFRLQIRLPREKWFASNSANSNGGL